MKPTKKFGGILLSSNSKTGYSINVHTCCPTALCHQYCYRMFRTQKMIDRFGWKSTPNTGPITWPLQQEAYRRNEETIKALSWSGELDAACASLACYLSKDSSSSHLRGNGTGDLFPELCEMYARLSMYGVRMFLFSRKPQMIRYLTGLCDDFGVRPSRRPFCIGSIDASTRLENITELKVATTIANYGHSALAYMIYEQDPVLQIQELESLSFFPHVIFGYHTNTLKTVISHPLACPATNGSSIKCHECRRCYGGDFNGC